VDKHPQQICYLSNEKEFNKGSQIRKHTQHTLHEKAARLKEFKVTSEEKSASGACETD
jgi:hypothetical protein